MWERLHAPFLAAADMQVDPVQKIEGYRRTHPRRLRVRAGASEGVGRRARELSRTAVQRSRIMTLSAYGGGGPRRSDLRLIIALVIAVIAIIGYLSKRSVNPVTGEKQHVALNAEAGDGAGPPGGAADGAADGRRARPDVRPGGARSSRRSAITSSTAATPASREPLRENFNFHLLNDPKTINAFALPGGQIFITRGLCTTSSRTKRSSPACSATRSATSSTATPPSTWPRASSAACSRRPSASAPATTAAAAYGAADRRAGRQPDAPAQVRPARTRPNPTTTACATWPRPATTRARCSA